MSDLFWQNDAQWARLQPLLPTDVRGVPRVDDRRVISGIIHVLRSGCRWVDAPPSYGPRKTGSLQESALCVPLARTGHERGHAARSDGLILSGRISSGAG